MSLRSDVLALRDEAAANLTGAHDHLAYSQGLWLDLLARRGGKYHRGRVVLSNPVTGQAVLGNELRSVVTESVELNLPSAAIQQFTSITEAFLADLVRLWLTAYPSHLKGKVDIKDIVVAHDKDAIVQRVIDAHVGALTYKSPHDWFEQINAMVALGAPAPVDVYNFAEVKATRDIFVHNRGIVNETYVRKAGSLARATVGQPLDLPDPYVRSAWELCERLTQDVGTAAAARA